jgi:hypothetical protein
MFDQSKVLIVEFQRPETQIGLILNKQARLRDGRVVNIGGPCDMEVNTTNSGQKLPAQHPQPAQLTRGHSRSTAILSRFTTGALSNPTLTTPTTK